MKRLIVTILGSALVAFGLCGSAQAQHRGFHGGFHGRVHRGFHRGFRGGFGGRIFVGPRFYDPFWYWDYSYPGYYPYYGAAYNYYPTYYYPPYEGSASQEPAPTFKPESGTRYYCNDPSGYYPEVTSCNTPWQTVAPAPPPS